MTLNPYGLTLSLAIFVAYFLTAYRASKRGLSSDFVWSSLPWVLFFGILGARFYHVFNFWSYYLIHRSEILAIWQGGLGIWGGLAGGLLGFLIYSYPKLRVTDYRLLVTGYLNAAAPAIPLAQAIGRWGNVWNGENLPYAYWEIVANLLIFGFLLLVERGIFKSLNLKRGGALFFLYLLCYSTTRFFLEFFRGDSPWLAGPLTMAQWVSLVVILLSLLKGLSLRNKLIESVKAKDKLRL